MKKLNVYTPNPNFNGLRNGVIFTDGVGKATKEEAEVLVRRWKYRCPDLETKKDDKHTDTSGFPEGYPHAALLAQNGFTSPEAVAAATDQDLRAINGIGPAALKSLREWKTETPES